MLKATMLLLVVASLCFAGSVQAARSLQSDCTTQVATFPQTSDYSNTFDLTGAVFPTCDGGFATVTSGTLNFMTRVSYTNTFTYDCNSYTYAYTFAGRLHANTQAVKAQLGSDTYVVVIADNEAYAGDFKETYDGAGDSYEYTSDDKVNFRLKLVGKGPANNLLIDAHYKCQSQSTSSYNWATGEYSYDYKFVCAGNPVFYAYSCN